MLLLANKPQWRTSNDVVQYLKHKLKAKKCGHAGTLDPMATGLMLLATDQDTKKLHENSGKDKSYLATIDLSAMSDTWDKEFREQFTQYEYTNMGIHINWWIHTRPTWEHIITVLNSLTGGGAVSMPLPPFSAKKIDWKKRYDMARQGNTDIVYQDMIFHTIEIIDIAFPLVYISCHVASGTYIRSLAYRLATKLWTWGILVSLQRTSIGEYSLDQLVCNDKDTKLAYSSIEIE